MTTTGMPWALRTEAKASEKLQGHPSAACRCRSESGPCEPLDHAEGLAAIAGLKNVADVQIGLPEGMLDDFSNGGGAIDYRDFPTSSPGASIR